MWLTLFTQVTDASQVGEARRQAAALAADLGFDEAGRGRVAIAATELATNLHRHGRGGHLYANRCKAGGKTGVELLALDSGPGLGDVARCLSDGYSTSGSAGEGLGAIRRQASRFDLHSVAGKGTGVLARFWPGGVWEGSKTEPQFCALALPYPGERVSGDAWAIVGGDGRRIVVLADGLGHGMMAGTAAEAATRVAVERPGLSGADLLQVMHGALRATRGAAVAIAEIDPDRSEVRYTGVGNIAGRILHPDGTAQSMVSLNGTVGHEMRKAQTFVYQWHPHSTLVMHSDGLGSTWRADDYPGVLARASSLLAGTLLRDFKRGRDDVTVLVFRPDVDPALGVPA